MSSSVCATEAEADAKYQHMRHVAASFLHETKAIHLERDLVDFLIKIDKGYQEQIEQLKLQLQAALLNPKE